MPYQILTDTETKFTKPYVYPIFEQKWNMFAPSPIMDGGLYVKFYFTNEDSTNWERPTQDAIDKHAIFRFTHHGEIALHESNLCYWVDLDVQTMIGSNRPDSAHIALADFKKGYSMKMLRHYVRGLGHYYHNNEVSSAKIMYHYHNVVTNAKGVVVLPDLIY